ncbi:MAG: sugar phosphate isomerase/epimerase [Deltaproteobacteria bacterium]|nr:sugar phosphate isomerase/epimerase [Deltaproteobacteria bacterium]MBT4644699.1 sugar phosphate isomerase/epimerase [Deltaproteobacteria bacterium]MBT6503324.1 sugar phosphate isomerase/epimerase [Deltaproteobacteria bacterium]MBT6613740.1 sugar phosphate isomerase/epimerase [Deltaproteobacteria bacterium]MBT7153920.1 sugar phosphate isomerase/epimerase [Deltaproteobacteria bacterium]
MSRPVTIFTGQWADLTFEDVCQKMSSMGYNGLEIACWGDHMDVRQAASDPAYVEGRKELLDKYGLKCWALGAHLSGQCVGDYADPRLDAFAPDEVKGKPDEIRKWAIEEMMATIKAAKNMGCYVVTGFMGSPIWKYIYSFPPTTPEMVEEGYQEIKRLWTPILDEFDAHGVKFALEVHPTEIAYDFYSTEKLFEVFEKRPALGLNFDPSHLVWQGVDPKLFIREFADRVYHVHMKDAAVTLDGKTGILASHLEFGDLRRGWDFRSLGHGDVNFEDMIRELNAAGYSGPLSVEWEDNGMDRDFGAAESVEFVKKMNFSASDVTFDGDFKG